MAGSKVRQKNIMPDTPAPPGKHWMVGPNGKPYLMAGKAHSAKSAKSAKKKRKNTSYY